MCTRNDNAISMPGSQLSTTMIVDKPILEEEEEKEEVEEEEEEEEEVKGELCDSLGVS